MGKNGKKSTISYSGVAWGVVTDNAFNDAWAYVVQRDIEAEQKALNYALTLKGKKRVIAYLAGVRLHGKKFRVRDISNILMVSPATVRAALKDADVFSLGGGWYTHRVVLD